jgi:lipopolysaccharide export system protein LptA
MTRPLLHLARCLAAAGIVSLAAAPASAQAPGKFTGLKVQGDQPIAIESDQLDVDDAKALATFTGNVAVSQGETLIKTSKLLVYYVKAPAADAKAPDATKPAAAKGALPGGNNQIDRIEASGKVYIKSTDQVATAETANFDMKTQLAVLTGDVVLSQGENVARGPKLTVHMDTGIAQFSGGGGGRIKMLMAPDQKAPAR